MCIHCRIIQTCLNGNITNLKRFIDQGIDLDQKNDEGFFPLYVAVQGQHINIINELIKNNANIDNTTNDGCTALMFACQLKNYDIVKILLNNNAIVTKQTIGGTTALHIACELGLTNIVHELLNFDSFNRLTDNRGLSALEVAGCSIDNIDEARLKRIEIYKEFSSRDLISCKSCNKKDSEIEGELNICEKCLNAVYCCRGCQKADWKEHKQICVNF
jgi:ankyrin repeat protein